MWFPYPKPQLKRKNRQGHVSHRLRAGGRRRKTASCLWLHASRTPENLREFVMTRKWEGTRRADEREGDILLCLQQDVRENAACLCQRETPTSSEASHYTLPPSIHSVPLREPGHQEGRPARPLTSAKMLHALEEDRPNCTNPSVYLLGGHRYL